MLWSDTAKLITVTQGENDIGDIVETETEVEVFVNRKSVNRSEFYQAHQTGFKPEIVLEIRTEDYNKQHKVEFEGVKYNIIRDYSKNQEITELVCEGLV
jgi:SPP1 family predicted phage head-tail adaptor